MSVDMASIKTKSQPSLLTRRVSHTDLHSATALPRTQSLCSGSRHGLSSTSRAVTPTIPAIPLRPGSSLPISRMEDEAASRPLSRVMSRMQNQQTDKTQRPKSGIRPLSSNVFMRRTERGWVAKHYPETPSITMIELDDELSDCDSLDSFFDEDFDNRKNSEKLGSLLTCSTLGVEAKSQKAASDIELKKFHCPRCRDHWYGLTPFPCDEELERLIREGLWYTGQGSPKSTIINQKKAIRHSSASESNRIVSRNKLRVTTEKNMTYFRGGGEGSPDLSKAGSGGECEGYKKNAKRRITFKLGSACDLESDGGGGGSDELLGEGSAGGSPITSSHEKSVTFSDEVGNQLKETNLFTSKISNNTLGTRKNARMDEMLDSDNSGLLEGAGLSNPPTKRHKKKKKKFNGADLEDSGIARTSARSGGSKTQLISAEVGMGLANALADNSNMQKPGRRKAISLHTKEKGGRVEGRKGRLGGETSESFQDSPHGEESNTSTKTNSTGKAPDFGRKVRKAVGYMRAVSPTSSEWGDPSHARPYASITTASSAAGSTSNVLGECDKSAFLPPLIPPIVKKPEPLTELSDLMGKFQFTPAWRFSYHQSVLTPKPSTAARTSPSKRRK